jgi:sulfite reductase alpha subunit-like flavoprotein
MGLLTDDFVVNSEVRGKGVASSYLCENGGDLFFTVQSNPSFHAPSERSKPLVMIAASTGVSPFIGFIQQRCSTNDAAETILLWSIPVVKEGERSITFIA